MVGANGTGARRGYIQMAFGIVLSLVLMSGYVALALTDPLFIWLGLSSSSLPGFSSPPAACVRRLSVSPAGFVGAAIFFGMMAGNPKLSLVEVTIGSLIPAAVGFCMGLLTMWLNAKAQPKEATAGGTTGRRQTGAGLIATGPRLCPHPPAPVSTVDRSGARRTAGSRSLPCACRHRVPTCHWLSLSGTPAPAKEVIHN